ncbi:MFS maltose permease [Pleurostoma richardsiae]|uniref:MFS maltose permease n=1 Tax=Pleurostoma richardsiae TaxID=41990 RepID=A0AA38VJ30_9PEZI|nr:MFS maltose permease [Pleurostoma richardsiae]
MRPRTTLRRVLLLPSLKSPTSTRTFTRNSTAFSGSRPQLPFLAVPAFSRPQWRYLTTERKRWLKYEFMLGVKYTLYFWAMLGCVGAAYFAIQQELLERKFPTPHEWAFKTRMLLRGAENEKERKDTATPDWVLIIQLLKDVLERLEDPNIDGTNVKKLSPDHPAGSKDISAMPEPWRRGYFETLLLYAKASEQMEGWVLDKTRGILFPPEVVIGPSNPQPRPIPPGAKSAPREEDCVPAGFPTPDEVYLKLLSTEGFTTRQRMEAALAYASWLEYKQLFGPAGIIYEDAVNMAIEDTYRPGMPMLIDPNTGIINEVAGKPSANLLESLTALATFKARHEDISSALPIMISLLKARRSLPTTATKRDTFVAGDSTNLGGKILGLIQPPPYPPPPDDGAAPPVRDPRELCEEAALHIHIGEIMYALQPSSREEGVAWTREGVDIAEEQLHKLSQNASDHAGKTTCRECLSTGLDNWFTMVSNLAAEEERKKSSSGSKSSWLGLWGDGKPEESGRWAAEKKVVNDRIKRAQDVLEDLEAPAVGFSSVFKA